MSSYRYVVNDLEKSLNQSFDDADITFVQILYWVQVISNRIRSKYLRLNKIDSFVSTFFPVVVNTDSKGRKYIDLPAQILDLKNNAGIVYITYNFDTCCCGGDPMAQVVFEPSNVGSLRTLYMDKYTTPTAKNPYFYRIADRVNGISVNRVYLIGIECTDVKDVEIGILATLDPRNICDLDDDIPLPDELIHEVITEVLKLGRFVMLVPDERLNDGSDSSNSDIPRVPSAPSTEQQPLEEQQ